MIIHFNDRAEAEESLKVHGFYEISNGVFVNVNKTVKATIHPVAGAGEVVCVAYEEIQK